jgi:hypothetical protein
MASTRFLPSSISVHGLRLNFFVKDIEKWPLALPLQAGKAVLESGFELPVCACGDGTYAESSRCWAVGS